MDEATNNLVRSRARERCEYCRIPEQYFTEFFQMEHIVARSHGGGDEPENLALACQHCNLHKGPNLSGIDLISSELTRLFNPRTDRWEEHFNVEQGHILGLTAIGRTTAYVLNMNSEHRIELGWPFVNWKEPLGGGNKPVVSKKSSEVKACGF